MTEKHFIHSELIDRRVHIAVAGVGGNGGHVLECLARLDIAIRALGNVHGLFVTAYDFDTVSQENIGRQKFLLSDVGEYKSVVAVERINIAYGFAWEAIPGRYEASNCDILISCVDTRSARAQFYEGIKKGMGPRHYWLDLGNEQAIGNCVL